MASTKVLMGGVQIVNQNDNEPPVFRPPCMTTSERLALTGLQGGCIVFDTDLGAHYCHNGSAWVGMGGHTHSLADITDLGVFSSGSQGLVPASGGGTTNFIRADGIWAAPAGGGGPNTVKKTSDQTFNSTTPANVTSLSFPITSGRYYEFRFLLLVRSATATVGVGVDVTVPGVTRFGYTMRTIIAADGAGGEFQGAGTASADAILGTAVPVINTDYIMEVAGLVLPSASGTLQLRGRTETGTTVVTIRQGSVGYLWDHGT